MTPHVHSTTMAVSVVTRKAQRVIGMVVRTKMSTAHQDAMRLWEETFGPRMGELAGSCGCVKESYGISWMVEEAGASVSSSDHDCPFDYWAALPVEDSTPIPAGMRECYLSEGLYAECRIASLEGLSTAYTHIYTNWLPAQTAYTPDMLGPCYELYPEDFLKTGRLTLYCALKAK